MCKEPNMNKPFKNKILFDLLVISSLVLVVNFFSMPKAFYVGDSYAIKANAINLVNTGRFGINPLDKDKIEGFLTLKGQYFHKNKDGDYHSRWGFFNTIVSSIPEYFVVNKYKNNLHPDSNSIWAHNVFNIFLSCIFAVLLFLICGHYSNSRVSKYFYVISIMYGTYVWNYLRTQSYEIVHLTLFALFYFGYLKYIEVGKRKWSFVTNLALMFLALSKPFYACLFPLFLIYCCFFIKDAKTRDMQLVTVFMFLATLLILFITNYLHFDSILFTKNASHDPYNKEIIPFSIGHLPSRLFDYLVGFKANLFIYFPLMLFLPLNFRRFYLLNRDKYLLIILISIFFFLVLLNFYSFGQWCYGPRFFVFILPFLTLPVLSFYEGLVMHENKNKRFLLRSFIIVVFSYSAFLQMNINKKDFLLSYRLKAVYSQFKDKEIDNYFNRVPTSIMIKDFDSFMNKNDYFFPFEKLASNIKKEDQKVLLGPLVRELRSLNQCNYFYRVMCSYF